jgi:hypothetical protein
MAGIPYINNYFGTKAQSLLLLKKLLSFSTVEICFISIPKFFANAACVFFFYHFDPKSIFRFKSSNLFLFLKIERKLRLICQKVHFLREKTFLLKHKSV